MLGLALDQRDRIGGVAVVTDARPDAVTFYERYGFGSLGGVPEGALRRQPAPMFLKVAI